MVTYFYTCDAPVIIQPCVMRLQCQHDIGHTIAIRRRFIPFQKNTARDQSHDKQQDKEKGIDVRF